MRKIFNSGEKILYELKIKKKKKKFLGLLKLWLDLVIISNTLL